MASNRHERRRDHAIHARRTKKDRPRCNSDRPTKVQTPTPAKGEAIRNSKGSMHPERRLRLGDWLRQRPKLTRAVLVAVVLGSAVAICGPAVIATFALGPAGVIYGPTVLQFLLDLTTEQVAAPAPEAPVQSSQSGVNIIVIPISFTPPEPPSAP